MTIELLTLENGFKWGLPFYRQCFQEKILSVYKISHGDRELTIGIPIEISIEDYLRQFLGILEQ